MSVWEYKVISSGKGGFATPALLEKFLGDLGRDEWEIIHYQSPPDNSLAFSGLARRPTQRDWTLQDAAAAAAKAEADKLRAEFEAKFKAVTSSSASLGAEDKAPASFLEEKAAPDDDFRKPVDTSRDHEHDVEDEGANDWDKLTAAETDELPNFFDAMKPHMRRNQRGPGMSVGVEFLAKKWDFSEEEVKGALAEAGFVLPEDEDSKAVYLEYDGDLYWLNINRRGELWINTKEKPRPVFKMVKGTTIAPEPEKPEAEKPDGGRHPDAAPVTHFVPGTHAPAATADASSEAPASSESPAPRADAAPAAPAAPLPAGTDLLRKIEPLMRRNRRGPGGSGSVSFLSNRLKTTDADLMAGFATLGLVLPPHPNDKPINVEIGGDIWWLNQDSRGGIWINGREKKPGEVLSAPSADTPAATQPGDPTAPTAPGSEAPAASESPSAVVPATDSTTSAPAADGSAPAPATDASAPAPTEAPAPAADGASAPDVAPAATTAPASDSPAPSAPSASVSETMPSSQVAAAPAPSEPAPAAPAASTAAPSAPAEAPAVAAPATNSPLAALRPSLEKTKSGAVAAKLDRLAETAGQTAEQLLATLTGLGLSVPEKPRERPVLVEHAGEVYWISKNPKGELSLKAKPATLADKADDEDDEPENGEEKKPRRSRLTR